MKKIVLGIFVFTLLTIGNIALSGCNSSGNRSSKSGTSLLDDNKDYEIYKGEKFYKVYYKCEKCGYSPSPGYYLRNETGGTLIHVPERMYKGKYYCINCYPD